MNPRSTRRYTLLALLYVSQAVPLGFFVVALPVILRGRGVSLERIGLLGALAFPWLIKFLWAPFVDRYGSGRAGHYRSWILPLQALSVACVLGLAALGGIGSLAPLAIFGGLFLLLAATQDVATDGLAVRILTRRERGPGNGIQVGGYYLGQVLGGGAMLVVFGRFGWTAALLAMAAFLALPLLPIARFREPTFERGAEEARIDFRALGRFLLRRENAGWLPVLIFFRASEAMALTMVSPMLVDLGYSPEEIGILLGVVGSLAALAGASAGGALVDRLGRRESLILFGLLQSAAIAAFLLPASGGGGSLLLFCLAATLTFTGGMATASLYTNMMDRCSPRTGATDFSLQQSLAAAGPLLAAAFSGFSAARLGYAGHFAACAGLSVAVIGVAARFWAEPIEATGAREHSPG